MRSNPEELTLLDKVYAWTFQDKAGVRKLSPSTLHVQRKYRMAMRRAETSGRFIVDDEAVKLVCGLSHEQERMAGWTFLARLPQPVCWFEFSLHTKLLEFDKMGTLAHKLDLTECSPRVGVLLYKDEPDSKSPRWVAHQFYEMEGKIYPGMVAYVFDPEGDPKWPVRGSKLWNAPTLSLLKDFPRQEVILKTRHVSGKDVRSSCDPELGPWGIFQATKTEVQIEEEAEKGWVAQQDIVEHPDYIVNKLGVIVDPWWTTYHAPEISAGGDRRKWTYELIGQSILEERGAARFLVILLAAINALPRDVKPIQQRVGKRAIGMNVLSYLGHSTLHIDLPRDRRVVWARKQLDRSARNSQRRHHQVNGHWVVIERGKSTHQCRHFPVMVESGLGICDRCELLVRWREYPEGRGDAAIGIMEQKHVVRAKKQQP